MFDYTKTAINKIVADFKKFSYRFNIGAQIVYIAYLIYALIANTELWIINTILLALSAIYFIFFLVATAKDASKTLKKRVKTVFKRCKQVVKFFTLGVMLYGIWQTSTHVDPLSVILTALMIVGWVLQILFEIILVFFLNKANFVWEAVQADKDEFVKPAKSVGNFFKRITGREIEEEKEPTKNRLLLDGMVEEYREKKIEEKKEKKRAKKEAQRQAKLTAKQKKKEEKIAKKAVKKKNKRVPAPIEELASANENNQ
ncbi:MAG: hypothetical protein IJY05_01665 [Clostridia bacterium]|nr:hypothetical protein [Clostridia bacterium]